MKLAQTAGLHILPISNKYGSLSFVVHTEANINAIRTTNYKS